MREMETDDDIIRDLKEFDKWFESHCGMIFRTDTLAAELEEQKQFEEDFEGTIKEADSKTHRSAIELVKKYRTGLAKFNAELSLERAFEVVLSKIAASDPKLKKVYDEWKKKEALKKEKAKPPVPDTTPVLPEASTKKKTTENPADKKDGSPEENAPGKTASKTKKASELSNGDPFSKRYPRIWAKTKKLKSLEGLENFAYKFPEIGSDHLFEMTRELITNGQIEDAVTEFEEDKKKVPWSVQEISNWFKQSPGKILESIDLFTAKNTIDLKKAIHKFMLRNSKLEQEPLLDALSELINTKV